MAAQLAEAETTVISECLGVVRATEQWMQGTLRGKPLQYQGVIEFPWLQQGGGGAQQVQVKAAQWQRAHQTITLEACEGDAQELAHRIGNDFADGAAKLASKEADTSTFMTATRVWKLMLSVLHLWPSHQRSLIKRPQRAKPSDLIVNHAWRKEGSSWVCGGCSTRSHGATLPPERAAEGCKSHKASG